MTQQTRGQATGKRPDTPRWVKALAVGAIVVVLGLIVIMLLAGGEHGPMRHGGWIDSVGWTSAARDA